MNAFPLRRTSDFLDIKNPYMFPILRGAESDYSVDNMGEVVNEAPVLVAGYQVKLNY